MEIKDLQEPAWDLMNGIKSEFRNQFFIESCLIELVREKPFPLEKVMAVAINKDLDCFSSSGTHDFSVYPLLSLVVAGFGCEELATFMPANIPKGEWKGKEIVSIALTTKKTCVLNVYEILRNADGVVEKLNQLARENCDKPNCIEHIIFPNEKIIKKMTLNEKLGVRKIANAYKTEIQMSQTDINKFLKDNGFWAGREAKNGCLWTDGTHNVMVARRFSNPRAYENLKADIKRAVKDREREAARITAVPIPKPEVKPLTAKLGNFTESKLITPPAVVAPPEPKPEPTKERQRRRCSKYDAPTRRKVWGVIREHHYEGFDSFSIAEAVNKIGLKMPDGKSPITSGYVSSALNNMRASDIISQDDRDRYFRLKHAAQPIALTPMAHERAEVVRAEPVVPIPKPVPTAPTVVEKPDASVLPAIIDLMLEDDQLTDDTKARILSTLTPEQQLAAFRKLLKGGVKK